MSEQKPVTARPDSQATGAKADLADPSGSDDETSPGPPRGRWWQALLWFGAGVLVAGVGVLGYAVLAVDDRYPMGGWRDAVRTTPSSLVAVGALSALATVVWVVVARQRWAAGKWTRLSRPRLLVPVVVVLLGAGIWSYLRWQYSVRTPFPGDRLLLVTSVYGGMLLGVALVIVAGWRIRSRRPMPRLRPGAAVVAFVGAVSAVSLAATAVVAVGGEHTRIDARTAAVVLPPPVPTDPSRVTWRWSDGVTDAVAAGAGVVVSTSHGVVALDGRTGLERWHYRHSWVDTLVAVDDGRGVVASFGGRLHAFDAFTGELWWREDAGSADMPDYRMSDDLLAAGSTVIRTRHNPDAPGSEVVARDARTGELGWRYAPSPECLVRPDILGTTVLVRTSGDGCSSDETTVALDVTTGELLWRGPPGFEVFVQGDVLAGSASVEEAAQLLDPRTGRTLGTTDGYVISGTATGEVITYFTTEDDKTGRVERSGWALVGLGEPAHRWQAPAPPLGVEGATFLDDQVAIVQETKSCPAGRGLVLVLLDRDDGTNRRSFACDDLPRVAAHLYGSTVWPAPGALIVQGAGELVALG